MKAQLIRLLGLMAGGLLLGGTASADVVTVSYYRLGEQDPGAAAGNPANAIAVDSGGAAVNLQRLGVTPTYSASTGVNGSTLCLAVNGGGYTNGAPILALTDNWGIEAWVSAASTNNDLSSDGYAQIAYNGNSGPSGMGLYAAPGGQFIGLVGGKAVVGGAPITPDTWTHLAMVVADGQTTFYVNGVANATGPAPATPAGYFGIGTNPSKPGGWEQFHGSIDEVRVFTVVPGTFTPDDLLLTNVPPQEPATIVTGPTAVPGNQLAYGSALSLTVLAGGIAPIQYQWWFGTHPVPGATNATLSFSSVAASNAGSYSVVVGNAYGPATTSAVVNVTVIVPSVTGSVIPVAYYRLGENDPGAANGQVGDATTVDTVSGLNLSVVGDSSTYSANTGVHGSTLSLAVDGAGGYNYATPIITNSGNWGLEAWVMSTNADNADNGGQGAIVLNGDFTAGNGLGIFQRGTQWQGLVTGLAWIGGATVVPNTWTHLAIVASASNTTFYVNGVANGTGPVPKPATSGDFSIGYDEYQGTPYPFQGQIDEVRAFTVLAGQFAVNDLLLNEVPPAPEAPSPFSAPTFTPAALLSVSNHPAYLSGQSFSISAVFAGTSPLQFQWWQGTSPVPGATNVTLSFSSPTTNNSGNYTVVVTNVYGAATSSVATVTVLPPGLYPVAYYRLGENDPGAANGQVANPQTVDFAGSVNPWQLGDPPTYTNNTGVAGSTLCIAVNGGGYTNDAPFALSGNWGIEAWAKADVAVPSLSANGYSQIAYNGNSGPGGMGLYQTPSGTFAGLCGGVALVGGTPVVPGTWTHLAMVYTAGATTFYVNGVAAATGPAPNPPPSFFGIGINPNNGGEPFQGSIDEVRVFTFNPGYFGVNDLLLNQVPPGHEAAAVLSGPTLTPGPTVLSGSSLSMSVQAAGTSPLQFQWFHNGAPIPGATTAILSFTNVTASASGAYYVTVTNAYGSGISGVATVTVFPPGSGSITEVAYYRLGENDPGAADGQVGNATTVDVVSGLNLSSVGNSSSYSANTGVPGSTLCLAVDGGGYTNVPVQLSDNWGLEAWAYSTNANNSAPGYGDVAFNGNYAGSGGMGFFQIGTHWNGLVSGIAWLPSPGGGPTVVPNTWTHLAIVTSGGTTTFYVNGVVAATGPAPAPVTGVGDFSIGFDANPYAGNASYFQGLIDEVRLFTFAPGQFTTNNLLLARVPPTPSLSILPVGGSVGASGGNLFVTWSVGHLLQANTPLGPWTTVTNATSPWLTPMVGPSGYFRAVAP